MLQFSSIFARGNEPGMASSFDGCSFSTFVRGFSIDIGIGRPWSKDSTGIQEFGDLLNGKIKKNIYIPPYIFLTYFDRTFPFFFFEKVFKSKLQTRNSPSSNEDERFAQVLPFVNYPRTRMKPEKVVSTRFPDNSGRGWLIIVSRDVNR